MDRDVDEEAARLLDRMAGEVPVAPPPLDGLVTAARRARRRRRRFVAVLVALFLAGGGVALVEHLDSATRCVDLRTDCTDPP